MNWRLVMNADLRTSRGSDPELIEQMATHARDIGYEFFVWNSKIYFIDAEGKVHKTRMTRDDITN